ncbi:hypothetical protein [Pseudomonas sp. BMS12]|uniref:hypothetical protein n=1 Tax=Pseudomonas sp. BMS12 TaxID=1796033 RepID=UPI0012907F43|nr:hypothetical protein [Pseudomonas sp. BMS12]
MSNQLTPLWVEFPNIPWGSIGWRMAWGEEYANKWTSWFTSLSDADQSKYIEQWPETSDWAGFYENLLKGAVPLWKKEREAKIAASAKEPTAEEDEIHDKYRILWMLRSYLKKPSVSIKSDGRHSWILVDPNGDTWSLIEAQENSPGEFTKPYLIRFHDRLTGDNNLEVKRPIP